MAFQVKNVKQALDALAFYSTKRAAELIRSAKDQNPLTVDNVVSQGYYIALEEVKTGNDFRASLDYHAPKHLKTNIN